MPDVVTTWTHLEADPDRMSGLFAPQPLSRALLKRPKSYRGSWAVSPYDHRQTNRHRHARVGSTTARWSLTNPHGDITVSVTDVEDG